MFITSYVDADTIFFQVFHSPFLNSKFYVFKIKLFWKFATNFSAICKDFTMGFTYLTKHLLNLSLYSFLISINPFIELFRSLVNRIWTFFYKHQFVNYQVHVVTLTEIPNLTFSVYPVTNSCRKIISICPVDHQ